MNGETKEKQAATIEIVHLMRQYKPSVGGLEDSIYNLCSHLSRREGIKVRIVTLNKIFAAPDTKVPRHEILDGIPVTRISCFGSPRYAFAFSVLNEIKSATIVHIHGVSFFFDFLALTQFFHRKPLIASTHGGFFHTSFASRLKRLYFQTVTRFSCRFYETLCASSENDAATFRCIAPKKVVTIENGVNIEKWKNASSPTPQRVMIFIGRWSVNKAVPVLIELIATMKKKGIPWSLIIVGVSAEDTAESLRRCAAWLGVSDLVRLHEGPSETEIAKLIGKASYIASASTYEGFGISAIEGLSAGLVPLLSPIAPFEKLRKALGFGAVIRSSDLAQSAQDIEELHTNLLANPEPMRQECMKLAACYDWGTVTDQFVEVYKGVVEKW